MFKIFKDPTVLWTTLLASGIMMITMGTRQSMGLYVGPINTATGLGMASISLALAVGQFVWGAIQPVAGAVADRHGPRVVLLGGVALLVLGYTLTPWLSSGLGLMFTLGLLSAAGAGAASFSVLIGASAQRIPGHARGSASGFINAGGSIGQFVFPPILQRLIEVLGWMGAMWSMAVITLLSCPLIVRLTQNQPPPNPVQTGDGSLSHAVKTSLKNPSYLLLHLGFFTCGFHIAFLITHLPTQVNLCGLPASVASWSIAIIGLSNIVGSIVAGSCVNLYRSKYILAWMYASRAILIALYLLAPKTSLTFYLFAVGLGLTWLATVPPTAGIVAKLFGVRYLGTLFGLTLLSHQIGGFFGAYLGGLVMLRDGDYQWMWYADMVLALLAALVNLPIKEAPIESPATMAQ
jgi:MFS family permease